MFTRDDNCFVYNDDALLLYDRYDQKNICVIESVKVIAQAAFFGHLELKTINLPKNLKKISKFAFGECSGLKELAIGSEVDYISDDSFDGCSNIYRFVVDENNQHYKSIDGVIYSKNGDTLVRVPCDWHGDEVFVIPETVKKIATNAFNRTMGISKVIIPDSVEEIGGKAFCYCNDLKEITIGKNITKIGYCAFSNAISLSKIIVEKNNKYFKIYKNVLYDFKMTKLIQLPCNYKCSIFKIPKTVSKIEDRALTNHQYLTTIISDSSCFVAKDGALYNCDMSQIIAYPRNKDKKIFNIPDSVNEIGGSCFQGTKHLKTIRFGKSVLKVSRHAFESSSIEKVIGCSSLENIGWHSFSRCSNIKKIDFSMSKLNYINGGAFSFCENLESVVLPSSISKIVRWCFLGCLKLNTIKFVGKISNLLINGTNFFINDSEFGKLY